MICFGHFYQIRYNYMQLQSQTDTERLNSVQTISEPVENP